MNDNARLGRLVLVAVIVVIALTELAVVGLTILAGTFRGGQVAASTASSSSEVALREPPSVSK